MRDPGLPVDGAPACPFVAFEDDRDARSTAPDHRHRCYAEPRPAPRALAHQEAYCLSSAFAVCPTFQDWARREAAATRPATAPAPPPRHETDPAIDRSALPPPEREQRHPPAPAPLPPHRPASRDWAAPPPWLNPDAAASAASAASASAASDAPPPFLADRPPSRPSAEEGRGLAGSPADLVASERLGSEPGAGKSTDLAVGAGQVRPAVAPVRDDSHGYETSGTTGLASGPAPIGRRDRVPAERADYTPQPSRHAPVEPKREDNAVQGPSWEQPRRSEAYPTLKTRVGLPSLPGSSVLVGFAALILAAVGLFFLPALLGVGGDDPSATPTASVEASPTVPPEPTPTPAPTPIVHVVSSGDTLSKIASQYGIALEDLLAANPQITDPNQIGIGDEVIIPAPAPSAPEEIGGEQEVTPAP